MAYIFTYYRKFFSCVPKKKDEGFIFVTLSRQTNFICENEPMKTQRKYT